MDKAIRILLAGGIAILFPVLVYFAVVTIMPSGRNLSPPTYPEAPTQPDCTTSTYDYTTGTYRDNTSISCQRQLNSYDQRQSKYDQKISQYEAEQKAYDANLKKQDKRNLSDRAVLATIIALIAIGLSAVVRGMKELAGGLVSGATLIIIVSISSMISYMGSTHQDNVAVTVITLTFGVLTGLVFFLDKSLPANPYLKTPVAVPAHPATTHTPLVHAPTVESDAPAPPADTTEPKS